MASIRTVGHPLAADKIARLRNKATDVPAFRRLVEELTIFLAIECTSDLQTVAREIETPLCRAVGAFVREQVVLVPILRAGLGMVDGMLRMLPDARVGHVGLYRDHATHEPVTYYENAPAELREALVVVLDPMLATGGSAVTALDILKRRGAARIRFCCLIAAPEGISRLAAHHPDVDICAIALDERLDERQYIIPGLGDAGDRMFGTL